MGISSDHKIILVKRRTRLEDLMTRFNTVDQAKFYIEHMGSDFSDYLNEDLIYKKAIQEAHQQLDQVGRVQIVDREFVPNFIFGEEDIVVVVGQDGLVANTLKYLGAQRLIGVNPDPKRWDGVLLPFQVSHLKMVLTDVINSKRVIKEVTMAKATLNDGQFIYGVNDLYIGQKTHVSSRYKISHQGKNENHSSSGIIVSTGLGSTGWYKSILEGASSIMAHIIGETLENMTEKALKNQRLSRKLQSLSWSANSLNFSVREPFKSRTTQTEIVFGKIEKQCPLLITSYMPENGVYLVMVSN